MLKKSFAFGLLAAGLMIAPGAALADVQSNQQNATQNGAAAGVGNTVVNNANQTAIQDITKIKNGVGCHASHNVQVSGQNLQQNGAAVGTANTVANVGSQAALQNATEIANGFHNCY
ncbi:filamentous hemagglutinin [Fischerella sp. FACHB-380]|uniref:filamentous hemagglutinin n=1 Tax=Fischerella sp. FACHB-380 TaxID=2692799 RepID=UPI00168634F6|nr:filamentous hemagglutinin [Fischerella sp. FACHB-380]MBD2431061.1 filamentous hemagglutinin [Fischerella sp. FACHB-380]